MPKIKDITGKKFGRLTVVSLHSLKNHRTYWECNCECGNSTIVYKGSLVGSGTNSCGCLQRECAKKLKYRHGMINTRFHNIWLGILSRCTGKNTSISKYYGAKGIKVCKEWLNFLNFRNDMYKDYLQHLNEHGEKDTSIDRINNKGNYNKKNCRWATKIEQASNTSRNRYIEYNNQKETITEWSRILGIHRKTIEYRIDNIGMSIYDAFNTPVNKKNK